MSDPKPRSIVNIKSRRDTFWRAGIQFRRLTSTPVDLASLDPERRAQLEAELESDRNLVIDTEITPASESGRSVGGAGSSGTTTTAPKKDAPAGTAKQSGAKPAKK